MNRSQLIPFIQQIAKQVHAFDLLENQISELALVDLRQHLFTCGIIPEAFAMSSSEEKIWAKYSDILLAQALTQLGIPSLVIRTRGDSADILGQTPSYSLIGDAKAFRLSRTAKNQKDFKITALDDWRREHTFACLVAPYYQYPTHNSQIYQQAIQRNVTLLAYIHLIFLLDHRPQMHLNSLWEIGHTLNPTKSTDSYWQTLENHLIQITASKPEDLAQIKQEMRQNVIGISQEGLNYWEGIIHDYQQLSQSEAVNRLIQVERIDQKISDLRHLIAHMEQVNGNFSE